MLFKKGAMFGLDARISLAIFGALSVISGAALHSAIEESSIVSLVTELDEVSKAIQAYILDTGEDLSKPTPSTHKYEELIVKPSGITGWRGPYFPLKEGIHAQGYSVNHPVYGNLLVRGLNHDLGGANYSNGCTVAPCYYWLQVNNIPEDLVSEIDVYVDDATSIDSGSVRVIDIDKRSLFYRGSLTLFQP